MKKRSLLRTIAVLMTLVALLTTGPLPAKAAPPDPPIPVSPAGGSTIVVPTFSWQASAGAAKYEIEIGLQSDPNVVSWSAQTVHLTLTPNDANKFPNAPLYWRVRAKDSSNAAGAWSSKINFTKTIPAPALVSPADGSTSVVIPTFEWQRVPEAAYYKVEVSTSPTFLVMEATYTTYNTRMTPIDTLTHGEHFWRVSGVDADGHVGESAVRSFTKIIPTPTLIEPADGSIDVITPTFEWQRVPEATYYQVELSTSSTFVPVAATYTTYNLRITPVDALAPGIYYWRVSGVDADGHVGENNWRRFTLIASPAATDTIPQLITPAHAEEIATDPTFSWSRVIGADHYRLVVSTNPSFSGTYDSVNTDYNSYTPHRGPAVGDHSAYANGIYYWKLEAWDSHNHLIATSEARSFTKQESLPLDAPADGAPGLTVDPTFEWSQIVGAHHYRLIVSTNPSFSETYDSVNTDYNSFTPHRGPAIGDHSAYANGTYYWKVEAWNVGAWDTSNELITTSAARSFTKQESLPLVAPADGAALASTPTFQWNRIVGAHHYRLMVSTVPSFSSTYDSVNTDYSSYTPYSPAGKASYAIGRYYWKVEAWNVGAWDASDELITASTTRTFTIGIRKLYLPLVRR